MGLEIISPFEEFVLLAITKLPEEDTYGVPIREAVEEFSGEMVSVGQLYTTLDRLEKKGFLTSRQGEATEERGGKAKRYYKIEGLGEAALAKADRVRLNAKQWVPSKARLAGGAA